jgi:hypothetical protein
MARGTESKNKIVAKICQVFPDAFLYDKMVIIPMEENGEKVQIKCALTCAKVNINAEGPAQATTNPSPAAELTQAEKSEVEDLITSLGL